jgi:S1-C subfamily serine protease
VPEPGRAYGRLIPSIDIQDFLDHPRAIYAGYLGVSGKTVSTGLGALNVSEGLQIERVIRPESNLKVGDILTWVDESPISTPRNLINAIRARAPGSKVKAFVIRQGVFTEITLSVGYRLK